MKIARQASEFLVIFAITFTVTALVTFLYSLLVHSEGVFDWPLAFRLSIIFAILFPWLQGRKK